MAKCGFKKTKTGFGFYGEVDDCISLSETRLHKLKQSTPYLTQRYDDEKRRFERHCRAVESLENFIALAKDYKENQKKEGNENG